MFEYDDFSCNVTYRKNIYSLKVNDNVIKFLKFDKYEDELTKSTYKIIIIDYIANHFVVELSKQKPNQLKI